jgi:hypothetical protein
MSKYFETEEARRLAQHDRGEAPWKKWGPYLSERQWGTVREDYSPGGDAWNYFSHEQSRSRAYRWGEDGLGGISDDKQRLCFALALWNGKDPILKERLFGLTNGEGNHGEDVKEYYFYLDSTPTHSYMKFLYKYPQAAYPYHDLVAESGRRGRQGMEYELVDTGIFDADRYFDVFVEYAKSAPDDVLVKITVENRGPEAATLHVLPTLWFRNTWAAGIPAGGKPSLRAIGSPESESRIAAVHPELGRIVACFDGAPALLFTENETNAMRLWEQPNLSIFVKDAFHEHLIGGRKESVNPALEGTKSAAHFRFDVPSGGARTLRVRLIAEREGTGAPGPAFDPAFERTFAERRLEADEFYDSITPDGLGEDERRTMRQALAGMLWSKQYYFFDLDHWLREHGANPLARSPKAGVRNPKWAHMINDDILSMPDKWEYPWYAAWDLAFHTTALDMVDRQFSRDQIEIMLSDRYLHPNGQLPAYEWNFGDVNPPVHAWATLYAYFCGLSEGDADLDFLRGAFRKLLLNFTWWVNRKDADSRNIFEGGFLGLDNIGVFDRSAPLPGGGTLEQADGTAWMAFFAQNMLEMSIELARHDRNFEPMMVKFIEHFLWIAGSMDRVGQTPDELWDEEDGFFYDVLSTPDGHAQRIKVRSMVGLLPLAATTVISGEDVARFPDVVRRMRSFLDRNGELVANIAPIDKPGVRGRRLLAVVTEEKLRRILARMLDESRFFSDYGIRSLSRWHKDHPYIFWAGGAEQRVGYLPAESDSGMFGGNSNWRGPIWMPVNLLILRALFQFYLYYGDSFRIECPTGSGRLMNLYEVAQEIARRLTSIFLRGPDGRRPVHGGVRKFQEDPHWRDLILFYEYFHGDNGAGIGASHQTGWTGTVAKLIQLFGSTTAAEVLEQGTHPFMSVYRRGESYRKAG